MFYIVKCFSETSELTLTCYNRLNISTFDGAILFVGEVFLDLVGLTEFNEVIVVVYSSLLFTFAVDAIVSFGSF